MKVKIYRHVINHFVAQLVGFIAALWAADFVSVLFERKNQKNLWGLTGSKPVLSVSTYQTLELVVSVSIGFIVLLLIDYFFEKKFILVKEISKKTATHVVIKFKEIMTTSNKSRPGAPFKKFIK
jgi:type III secretory pathway component EscU